MRQLKSIPATRNTTRKVVLFTTGLALTIGGIYAIDHIDTILGNHRWTFQILAGLGIGAVPLIIGVFLMTIVGLVAYHDHKHIEA